MSTANHNLVHVQCSEIIMFTQNHTHQRFTVNYYAVTYCCVHVQSPCVYVYNLAVYMYNLAMYMYNLNLGTYIHNLVYMNNIAVYMYNLVVQMYNHYMQCCALVQLLENYGAIYRANLPHKPTTYKWLHYIIYFTHQ